MLDLERELYTTTMFVRSTKVKGNRYFYLVESVRMEGRPYPAQRMIEYLGNQSKAIAKLEASNYPNKDELLARVREGNHERQNEK